MKYCQRRPLAPPSQRRQRIPNLRGLRALVLDNHPLTRGAFHHLLESLGFETRTTRSTAEILRLAEETPPELILLGSGLLGTGEEELLKSLRGKVSTETSIIILLEEENIRPNVVWRKHNIQVSSKWAGTEALITAIRQGCCRS